MTLKEFYKELESHDWFYAFSDDHRYWSSGVQNYKRLEKIAEESPAHQKLLKDYHEYIFSGPTFGTDDFPKPAEPED